MLSFSKDPMRNVCSKTVLYLATQVPESDGEKLQIIQTSRLRKQTKKTSKTMCQVPYEYNMPAGNKEDRLEDKAENKQLKVTYTKYS